MIKTEFSFSDSVYGSIFADKYLPEASPKVIIQVVHGMAEHAKRYEYFAQAMCSAGFGVYVNDLPGHGRSAEEENLGHLQNEGFDAMLESVHNLTEIIKSDYPNTPIILLGHSMGSFIAQAYICKYGSELSGCILSGTSGPSSLVSVGSALAAITKALKGDRHRSKLLDNMSFGSYNNYFKPNRTPFDWLSRDNEQVDKYINDSHCGFTCTTNFYQELFKGLKKIHSKDSIKNIPNKLPIYIFCGDKDPVGGQTESVMKLINIYKANGIQNLYYKFYKEGRHEMLNEINKDEVINDIILWNTDKL